MQIKLIIGNKHLIKEGDNIDEDENNNKCRFIGEDCGEQLLKSVKSDVVLMAHNAKYDMRFLIKHLSKCSEIVNGSSFITFSGYYKKFKITIKDSYYKFLIINKNN